MGGEYEKKDTLSRKKFVMPVRSKLYTSVTLINCTFIPEKKLRVLLVNISIYINLFFLFFFDNDDECKDLRNIKRSYFFVEPAIMKFMSALSLAKL